MGDSVNEERVARQGGSAGAGLRLIKPYLARYASRLAGGFVALVIVDLLQLGIPRFIKQAVDLLESGKASQAALARSALAILLLALAIAGTRFLWRYLLLGFSRLLERDIRAAFFRHLLGLDRVFFQQRPVGEVMALASNDLAAVQLAAGMGMVASIDAAVMSLAALACMAYISPSLTLTALLPMPLLALLTKLLSRRLHRRFLAVQEQFSRLTEAARSAVNNIRLLKAYGQERAQVKGFGRLGRDYVRDNIRLAMVHGTLFPISGLVGNASLLLVLFFGGRQVIAATITMGDFVAFISYLGMLTWPMMAVGWVANLFQRGMTSLGRLAEVFASESSLAEPLAPEELPADLGIRAENLSFSYGGQSPAALRGFSFQIRAGETVGIVGRSGSGKTTLCHLLARLYPVADQSLFFGGRDVNRLAIAAVRGRIAYVPQDVLLFSETIAANIALGRPEATMAEIEEAARLCQIHEEIMAFPQGYETRIGERGVKLSGGQRQRISLARGVLLDRPVLIIDDSLSAVDLETEQAIIRGLAGHLSGRTCLIVSHRIAPLKEAARILVLEEGRVLAEGEHDQLLARSDFYRTMYRQQRRPTGEEERGHAG
ncbi:ABC transporter ATP-binding protein [Thiovibrio sp. JS02]